MLTITELCSKHSTSFILLSCRCCVFFFFSFFVSFSVWASIESEIWSHGQNSVYMISFIHRRSNSCAHVIHTTCRNFKRNCVCRFLLLFHIAFHVDRLYSEKACIYPKLLSSSHTLEIHWWYWRLLLPWRCTLVQEKEKKMSCSWKSFSRRNIFL